MDRFSINSLIFSPVSHCSSHQTILVLSSLKIVRSIFPREKATVSGREVWWGGRGSCPASQVFGGRNFNYTIYNYPVNYPVFSLTPHVFILRALIQKLWAFPGAFRADYVHFSKCNPPSVPKLSFFHPKSVITLSSIFNVCQNLLFAAVFPSGLLLFVA